MREILFRGKAFNGEWEYGVPVFSGLNNELAFMKQMHSYDHQVIPETIGQYTGLTDKNGKKVFEGDIVKYGDTINKVVFENRNGTAYFGVVMDIAETWHFCYLTNAECMEVIGNIHDNPELLKECEG